MTRTITSVIFSLLIVSFISVHASTQGKTKGKIIKAGNKAMISVSLNGNGGTAMSSGVSKAFSFNPNASMEVAWGNFGLGVDASTFTSKSNFDFDAYTAPLKGIDFLTVTGASSNWKSTSILVGPSYTIPFGLSKPIPGVGIVVKHNYPKATLTLSVKGGVTMNQAPDNFSVTNNVTRKQIASYSAPVDFKKNAFTLKPSANFSYWLSQNIALNANVQYAMQTGQTAFTTGYKDLTNVNLAPPLSPDQFNKNISTAPNISTTTVGPDKYLSAGIGITYRFGKKGWDGSIKGNRKGIKEQGLKKNEDNSLPSDAIAITPNFAVGKYYITIPHDLQNRKENTDLSTNPSEKKFNPNENTGGPSNQVFGYEEAASLELCIQFLDAQGSETDYGSGVCFINTILCPDDVGAITNGGSHVYVPSISEKLNGLPINVLLLTTTKNGKFLNGKEFNLKTDVELSADVAESLNCEKVSIKAGKYKYNEFNAVEIPLNMVGRKGWDGSIKGTNIESKHAINTKGTGGTKLRSGVIAETGSALPNQLSKKGINEAGINQNEAARKGIRENGLKKNDAEYVLADADLKAIAETLVTMRKGWDGTVKGGNIAEKKGIKENGLKKNEAITLAANTEVKAIAETLVDLARKGWDGSIKGTKAEYVANKSDIKTVTQTLENIRKGWDGSIKGNKAEYVANDADVKAIAETLVNLRKGWDGSLKGNKIAIKEQGVKKNEAAANTTSMNVPHTGKVNPKNGLKVSVMGSGQTDAKGTPIIEGKTVSGSLFSDNSSKHAFVEVSITQAESGDIGSVITDEKGNFSVELNHDTLHTIALNGVEFGEIKLTERKGWDGSVKGNNKGITQSGVKKNESARKGWDGSIKGSNVSIPINEEVIHVQTTPEGCIVLFADNGFTVNSKDKTITALSKNEHADFGEKVNAGLHAAGGALAQGASLLGGALPGGAIISAAVSSVSTLVSGAGGGAAGASYAKTAEKKKKILTSDGKDDDCDGLKDLPDGEYELEFVIEEKTSTKSKKEQTQVIIEFSSISNVLKTKHDTAKNSVNNVR